MNLQSRIDRYTARGFQASDGEILVLIEETASALFSAFPERFVLFGGATLVLFYESPRLSRDLDLLSRADELPSAEEIKKVVETSIQPLGEALGLGKLTCEPSSLTKDFIKIWVQAGEKKLFTIDLTKIGGTVLHSELVEEKIAGEVDKKVVTPTGNFLLLQKCETFLARIHPKCRDAFDIHVLLSKEAKLDHVLEAHLSDFIQMRELDCEIIRERIEWINTKRCTAELRNLLPSNLFEQIESNDFGALRDSLKSVYSNWI